MHRRIPHAGVGGGKSVGGSFFLIANYLRRRRHRNLREIRY